MSATPETDALLSDQLHDNVLFDDACAQLSELCRKLERERDEARALLAEMQAALKWATQGAKK